MSVRNAVTALVAPVRRAATLPSISAPIPTTPPAQTRTSTTAPVINPVARRRRLPSVGGATNGVRTPGPGGGGGSTVVPPVGWPGTATDHDGSPPYPGGPARPAGPAPGGLVMVAIVVCSAGPRPGRSRRS